jgi:hypothetical protein
MVCDYVNLIASSDMDLHDDSDALFGSMKKGML